MLDSNDQPITLDQIGLVEFLEQDPRPSFVLEPKEALDVGSGILRPVVCNTALLESGPLLGAVVGTTLGLAHRGYQSHANFRRWIADATAADRSAKNLRTAFTYQGYSWTRITLQRWAVISGSLLEDAGSSDLSDDLAVPSVKRPQANAITNGERSAKRRSSEWASDPARPRLALHDSSSDADTIMENSEGTYYDPNAPDEVNFQRLAEVNPAGVFVSSPIGKVRWANDAWYMITDHPRTSSPMSFMECLMEDDLPLMKAAWHELLVAKKTVDLDVRLRKKWYHEASQTWKSVWIHADVAPELDLYGSLKSVMGCIRNISTIKQAEEDQVEHTKVYSQLAYKTQQYSDSENRFALMADLAPYGIFAANAEGAATWANNKFCEMTQQPTDMSKHYPRSSYQVVAPEHHPLLDKQFERLVVQKQQVSFEYRTLTPCVSYSKETTIDTHWHHCIAFPELSEDGSIQSIMGILTDITHMKAAEALQIQRKLAAEEAKREQEKFMDITSHELRNPLSAILQSADSIITTLIEYQNSKPKPNGIFDALIESSLDSVQVIMLCAQHQGRIINDVLTLSKLDSGLLLVSVTPTQPIKTVQQALKMFEAEVSSHDMDLEFDVEESYRSLEVDWVMVDPARLTQVFINLMTNAIKFTKSEKRRMITVTIGALKSRPENGDIGDIEWFPTRSGSPSREPNLSHNWTDEGQIYLMFAVQDTGRGLSYGEKTRLFNRFSQANPRTHVEYGGSGLGLFISRELTERQGGEIGVRSVAGEGSTFAFYVKAHKTEPPTSESRRASNYKSPTMSRKGSIAIPRLPERSLSDPLPPPPLPSIHSNLPSAFSAITPASTKFEVLLVEDNVVNQKVLSKQLLKAGCTVHLANHGQEALDQLRGSALWTANGGSGKSINIVLMDLEMPIMNGMTAVKNIRDMQTRGELIGHVPVIAVTANARTEQVEESLQGGMDDVMAKPFLMKELLPKMERLLGSSRGSGNKGKE